MTTKQTLSTADYVLYYVIIAISAVFIVLPAMRTVPFAKVVVSLMIFALLASWIWRDRKRGDMKLTVSQIYSKAKLGHRFAPMALEFGAAIVTFIAFWLTI